MISLAGTFLAALLLIPLSARSARSSCSPCRSRWSRRPGSAAASGCAGGDRGAARSCRSARSSRPRRAACSTRHETAYQYARVVGSPTASARLELNEGQAVHSEWRAGTVLTGDYWDGFLVLPFAAAAARRRGGSRSSATPAARPRAPTRATSRPRGSTRSTSTASCSNRPSATSACATAAAAADDRRRCAAVPARTDARYDAIFLDTYRQPYIPFYLTTREFFELARERLTPGGMIIINVGHPDDSDALEKVLSATLRAAFPYVARDPIEPTTRS